MQRAVLLPVLLSSLISATVAFAVGVLLYPPYSHAAQGTEQSAPTAQATPPAAPGAEPAAPSAQPAPPAQAPAAPGAGATTQAPAVQPVLSVVRAERLEIVDGQGTLRMRLGVEDSGAANVVVYDASGRMRVALGLADDGQPIMGFWDPNNRPRVGVGFNPAGDPNLVIRNPDGNVTWQAPPPPSGR
ncbi:MAG TPA: hypothetical protein VFE37_12980 [Chloroflexota bacterium]|nr:hypothetical protein [Chloroflexota bacterium]